MDKFLTLMDLQKAARDAPSREALGFILVNSTQKLVPYDQAVFWIRKRDQARLKSVSGNAVIDQHGEYTKALEAFLSRAPEEHDHASETFARENLSADLQDSFAGHAVHIFLRTEHDGVLGGLWLERAKPFHEAEIHVLEELAQSYAQALVILNLRGKKATGFSILERKINAKYIAAVFLALALFPVRLNVTAPAEIVARDPVVMTIPYDGILEKVHVRPGDSIEKGQLLASMDKTTLRAQMDMTAQSLEAAQLNFSRLSREALASPEKKAELNLVRSEIRTKKIDVDHAKALLERSDILSPASGVAIFPDVSAIEGKPLSAGEKIMIVAEPANVEILVRIPSGALVPIDMNSPVSFYLNVSPLFTHSAKITSIGYQASPDPDGLLTYKVRASLSDPGKMRIGWNGSARISGEWTVLGYSLLRRPLIALRNLTEI